MNQTFGFSGGGSGGGGGSTSISGTSWILVKGEGTASENGLELQTAYDNAKLMTPYGQPLSATNRYTIYVGAGNYYYWDGNPFTANGQFLINTNYIDIVSLSGEADVFLSGISITNDSVTGSANVYLKGINVTRALSLGGSCDAFALNTNNNTLVTCDTCVGGDWSYGAGGSVNGTFINCIGGDSSFAGIMSFSAPQGVNYLGFSPVIASGIFTDCIGGDYSFGSAQLVGDGQATGTFNNCVAGIYSLGFASVIGIIRNCIAGSDSFTSKYSYGTVSGTIFNSTAQGNSFGNNIEGYLYYCKLYGTNSSEGTFSVSGASFGAVVGCIDWTNTLINLP